MPLVQDGGIKQMYAASEDELMACRSNAKAEGNAVSLVMSETAQPVVVCSDITVMIVMAILRLE